MKSLRMGLGMAERGGHTMDQPTVRSQGAIASSCTRMHGGVQCGAILYIGRIGDNPAKIFGEAAWRDCPSFHGAQN